MTLLKITARFAEGDLSLRKIYLHKRIRLHPPLNYLRQDNTNYLGLLFYLRDDFREKARFS